MKRIVLGLIGLYSRFISPMMGPHCRFYPSCSSYAREAIETHGLGGGLYLTVKRISTCHPLHTGGYDPVPGKKNH